jgi:hypothetical protein
MAVRCTTVFHTSRKTCTQRRGVGLPNQPLETIANGKPMDKEKSVHEPMVERRQQGCQSGAGPSQGGSDKATVGASRANSSLLDQHLADPHQAQATAVKRDCRVDIAGLTAYFGVWQDERLAFDIVLSSAPSCAPHAHQHDS